jgi:hypothetical protein
MPGQARTGALRRATGGRPQTARIPGVNVAASMLQLQRLVGNKAMGGLAQQGGRPKLRDAELERLVSTAHNADVDAIAALVADMEQRPHAAGMKRDYTEEIGKERDDLVAEIRQVHDRVATLAQTGLNPKLLLPLQIGFYKAINKASPSYWQSKNIDILEPPEATKTRTCNITSLSMALEALGRTAADYNSGDYTVVAKIAAVYAPEVAKARDTVGKGLGGLRLPDFVELAAIAECLGSKPPTPANIRAAADQAWKKITSIYFLLKLAARFGVKGRVQFLSLGGVAADKETKVSNQLSDFGSTHRKETESIVDARIEKQQLDLGLEVMFPGADRDKAEKQSAKLGKQLAHERVAGGGEIEKQIPLDEYKRALIAEIGRELNAGHEIVGSITRHYVRVEAVSDEYVTVDDPGRAHRANRQVQWDEARAMGYLKYWLTLSA